MVRRQWQCLDMIGVNEGNTSPLTAQIRATDGGNERQVSSDQGGDALLTRSGNEKLACVTDIFPDRLRALCP